MRLFVQPRIDVAAAVRADRRVRDDAGGGALPRLAGEDRRIEPEQEKLVQPRPAPHDLLRRIVRPRKREHAAGRDVVRLERRGARVSSLDQLVALARAGGCGIVLPEAEAGADRGEDQRPATDGDSIYQGISLFE